MRHKFYLRYGVNTIPFPGDITPEGMERILDDGEGVEKRFTIFEPNFSEDHPNWHQETSDQAGLDLMLDEYGLSILVAPHHGLESCFSQKLYEAMKDGKPQLVVISEKRHARPQDGEIHSDYRSE